MITLYWNRNKTRKKGLCFECYNNESRKHKERSAYFKDKYSKSITGISFIAIMFILCSMMVSASYVEDPNGNYIYGYPQKTNSIQLLDGTYRHTTYREFYNNMGFSQNVNLGIDFKDQKPESSSKLYKYVNQTLQDCSWYEYVHHDDINTSLPDIFHNVTCLTDVYNDITHLPTYNYNGTHHRYIIRDNDIEPGETIKLKYELVTT